VKQTPDWLADELLRAGAGDPVLAARLKAAAGADRAGLVDLSRLRQELDAALAPGQFVEYRWAHDYAQGIDDVLDDIEHLTSQGFPESAIEAVEYALELLDEAMGRVDDSDGWLGGTLHRAQEIHLGACQAARPDPVPLGEHLAGWALRSEWEVFLDAPAKYADVLGPEGLASFEAVVDDGFNQLPRLGPSHQRESGEWSERWRVTSLKEGLAARRGADDLVAVISHDLSSPYQFLRAAEALGGDGRPDEALAWLSRGNEAFDRADPRLDDYAADLHHQQGRHDHAARIGWQRFAANPGLAPTGVFTHSPPPTATGPTGATPP
jgi:tetratricopeptide (TPR) repeat protein